MKYIIVRIDDQMNPDFGKEFGIVFPDAVTHRDVAKIHRVGKNIFVSAGFCHQNNAGEWLVWGESVSTERKSRPEDAEILKNSFSKSN